MRIAKESLESKEIYAKNSNENPNMNQDSEQKAKLASLLLYLKEKMLLKVNFI